LEAIWAIEDEENGLAPEPEAPKVVEPAITEEDLEKMALLEVPEILRNVKFPPKPSDGICPFPFTAFNEAIKGGTDCWSSLTLQRNRWIMPMKIPSPEYLLVPKERLNEREFWIETCKKAVKRVNNKTDTMIITEPDTDYQLYDHFLGSQKGKIEMLMCTKPYPCIIVCERQPEAKKGILSYKRAMFFSKEGFERKLVCADHKITDVIQYFEMSRNRNFVQITSSQTIVDISKALSKLEKMLTITHYKFGLIYVGKDQYDENDIYSNQKGSKEYQDFCSILGDTIDLKGYKGYRGGLDVKFNETGTQSIVTNVRGYEIMFHVATMLPFQVKDDQKVERKRHIGNDVVVLIFKDRSDNEDYFDPKILTSHFNSVFFIVSPHFTNKNFDGYILNVVNKSGIMPYPPFFETDTPFFPKEKSKEFIDFLLLKMINSERTALHWGEFGVNVVNTRLVHLQEICDQYAPKLPTQQKGRR